VLAIDLALLARAIQNEVDAAACFERARYQLVLCASPPGPLAIVISVAIAVGLAAALGYTTAKLRRAGR
jgi:hypothetical protein